MTGETSMPTYLHKLHRIASLVQQKSTYWKKHMDQFKSKQADDPPDISLLISSTTSIAEGLTRFENEVDSLNLRTLALRSFAMYCLPSFSLPGLLREHMGVAIGSESASSQIRGAMPDVEYELGYHVYKLTWLERRIFSLLALCRERADQCLRVEGGPAFRKAVGTVTEMRRREIEQGETEFLMSVDEIAAVKYVGVQHRLFLQVLETWSDLGQQPARQRLITEFFCREE